MSRNFDNLIGEWLADEAPSEAPDWIVQEVLQRTQAMPHRRTLAEFLASGPALAGAGVMAALVLAFVVGIGLGGWLNRSGGPPPSASPSPSAQSTAAVPEPRPTDIPLDGSCEPDRDCLGVLEPGTYRSDLFDPPVGFTVQESGWQNWRNTGGMVVLVSTQRRGDGLVLYQDATPRTAEGQVAGGVGDGAIGFVAWLAARSDLEVSEPQAASIGGLSGQTVEMRVRDDAPNGINGCPTRPCVQIAYGIESAPRPTWTWNLDLWRGSASQMTVLENGDRLVLLVLTAWYADELGDLVDRSQPIVDSLTFGS